MKKDDLKDGMIIVTKGEGNAILLGNRFVNQNQLTSLGGVIGLDNYDEDLKCIDRDLSEFDIVEVYKIINMYGDGINLEKVIKDLPEGCVKRIWPKREIDWTKIPFGTKVIACDYEEDLDSEEYASMFVGYYPQLEEYPFVTADSIIDDATSYRYCRIHPDVEIKEEWYK